MTVVLKIIWKMMIKITCLKMFNLKMRMLNMMIRMININRDGV